MENEMETTIVYWGYNMGIMENQMGTTMVYWGFMRILPLEPEQLAQVCCSY